VAEQLAASQEITHFRGVNIPLMFVSIPFGTGQKRPLKQCHSLIHSYRNNPALFPHTQFLVQIPEVVSTTMLLTATEDCIPVSIFLHPSFFTFCEKLVSSNKPSNLKKHKSTNNFNVQQH
jgi:hypothetical protein